MTVSYPLQPIKGSAYTVTFGACQGDFYGYPVNGIHVDTCLISKDGGAFVNTTNAPTIVHASGSSGSVSVSLTATEMNASIIQLQFYDSNAGAIYSWTMTVYTTGISVGGIDTGTPLPNITAFSSFTNPTVQEVLSVLWQGMTNEAAKKNWTFSDFLKKWNF